MFLRFVIHRYDEDSGRRQGVFQALGRLEDEGTLLPCERREYEELRDWFRQHLKKPTSFTRSSKPHAKEVALSWFRDSAAEHIARMRALVRILQAHAVLVDEIHTEKPGYIVYEDEYQVAAQPFKETAT